MTVTKDHGLWYCGRIKWTGERSLKEQRGGLNEEDHAWRHVEEREEAQSSSGRTQRVE